MLNAVILMGRLTADPELKYTPNDVAVTSFTLAVERSYQKSGTDRETDFISIIAWRKTAEFVCNYFSKGQLVAVQGTLQTRSYTDRDGNKRKVVEVVADNVFFAESKNIKKEEAPQRPKSEEPQLSLPNSKQDDFENVSMYDCDLPF